MMRRIAALLGLFMAFCGASAQADWLRFRGPNGSGISPDTAPTATDWSPAENIRWKLSLPGPGFSSPIIVGNRVFVTCYSGYGVDREAPGKMEDLQRHLVCVDLNSGDLLWERSLKATQPEDPYEGAGVPTHGYASHTPVSDGQRVYAFLGKSGVVAFDLEGNRLWQTNVGTGSDEHRWGSSSSPVVYKDLVIVTASAESQSLVALNRKTGEEVWRQEAGGLGNVWGTPVLINVEPQRTDLVLGVPYELWGINPENGKLRWFSEAMETDQYSSSVVAADGVVYGIEGRGGGSIAVRVRGTGDVSDEDVSWSGNDSARFGTPLVYQARIYFVSNGVANAIAAADGSPLFQGRLPEPENRSDSDDDRDDQPEGDRRGGGRRGGGRGGFGSMDFSSPVAANGLIYYFKSDGTGYVFRPGDEFDLVSVNRLTGDQEKFGGTPAISDGAIVVRSNQTLYCIAEPVKDSE